MLYCHCERLQGAKSSLREIWRSHDNLTKILLNQKSPQQHLFLALIVVFLRPFVKAFFRHSRAGGNPENEEEGEHY